MDCLIIAVAHNIFTELDICKMLSPGGLLVDVKGMFESDVVERTEYKYWRL